MSTVDIAVGTADSRAVELSRRSRRLTVTADVLRGELSRIGVGGDPTARTATHELAAAGRDLSAAAGLIADLARSAVVADRFGDCTGTSSAAGDPNETFTCGLSRPWRPDDHDNRGVGIMTRALADTANESVIGRDEFEIVRVAEDRYVLVLPGVTDLRRPDLGYDERSRTVRDLDQGAVRSATGPEIADNEYGRYVREAVGRYVPDGAEIAIVGHSYGADTGLDLAADPTFNGQRYTVTHVAAFGYHVKHQIGAVPEHTEVLAVNNSADAVVLAESVADGPHLVVNGQVEVARSLLTGKVGDARKALGDIASGLAEIAGDVAALPTAPANLARRTPSVSSSGSHHIVVFAGGIGLDAGHGQRRYIDFVGSGDVAAVNAFGASLAHRGFAPVDTPTEAITVDISRRA